MKRAGAGNHVLGCRSTTAPNAIQPRRRTLLGSASFLPVESRSSGAIGPVGARIDGRRSAARRLARAGLDILVNHPPGRLASALVLHPDEPRVERKVVPDGILERKRERDTLRKGSFLG